MLDFADLLTVVADGVKRKPNKKPEQQALPSDMAMGEIIGGAEQAISIPANYTDGTPTPNQGSGEMFSLPDSQQSATMQGVADEPANADNIQTTTPEMGMKVYPRPQMELPPAPQDTPVVPRNERRKLSIDEQIARGEDELRTATDAEIKPQSFWKDFGAKLIQGADVFFNGSKAPIVGWGRLKHDAAVDKANAKLNPLLAMRKEQEDSAFRQARTGTIINDDVRQAKAAKDLTDWRTSETNRKINADVSRERTARMTQVAGMFKSLPAYDPADPKFKELTEALGDVGLPLTPKDAKKKVDLKQDQRTGAWTVILTNPVTGQQEARNVVKDGKPFASTPTVVMQGELGLLKQNDQQAFTEQQNTLDRNLRVELQNSVQSFGREQTLQKATDAYKQLYVKTNGKNPTQAEIDAYITNTVTPMLEVGMNPIP